MKSPTLARPALLAALAAAATLVAPAPATAQSACGAFYAVESGETLLEIAQTCGVTLPALVAANPGVRDREDFEVGDRLRIPDPRDPQPSPVEACGPFYTVRAGDSLSEIAQKCGLPIPLLVAANPPLPRPLGNFAGRQIRIPPLPRAAVEDPRTLAVPIQPARVDTTDADGTPAAADTAAAPAPELTRVEGVLERGARCLRIRTGDGEVFAIAGEVNEAFGVGDRVVLMGVPAEDAGCQYQPTLELRILYRAGR